MDDKEPNCALVIDDDGDTASLIRDLLQSRFGSRVEIAGSCSEAREKLIADDFDVVTLDYRLPDGDGFDLLDELSVSGRPPQVIMVTGHGDEEVASHALRHGVAGYVIKDADFSEALSRSFQKALDRIDRKAAEQRLSFQAYLLDAVERAVMAADLDGTILYWSRFANKFYGIDAADAIGRNIFDLAPGETIARNRGEVLSMVALGESWTGEVLTNRADGTQFYAMLHLSPTRDADGGVSGLVGVAVDVTDRRRAEDSLRKMINETNERREEITALLESTRYVLEHADFGEAARAVYDLCKKLIGAGTGFVALLDPEATECSLLFTDPPAALESGGAGPVMPIRGLKEAMFRSGKAMFDNEFQLEKLKPGLPEGHPEIGNILCSPLITDGKAAGLMCFANKPGGFTNRDAMLASAFSEISALALRGTRALDALREERNFTTAVLDTAGALVVVLDTGGRVVQFNRACEQTTGYSFAEVRGRFFWEVFIVSEDMDRVMPAFQELVSGDFPNTLENFWLTKRGERRLISWTNTALLADDSVQYIVSSGIDVTEHRQAEEALRDSEERYRRLVETAPDVFYTISMDGTITSLNPAFERFTGWSSDEWTGRSFAELVHPDDLQKALETFEQAASGRSSAPYELRIMSRSGEYVHGEFVSAPQLEMGEVVGEFGVARDITERKKAEWALEQAQEKLRGREV